MARRRHSTNASMQMARPKKGGEDGEGGGQACLPWQQGSFSLRCRLMGLKQIQFILGIFYKAKLNLWNYVNLKYFPIIEKMDLIHELLI